MTRPQRPFQVFLLLTLTTGFARAAAPAGHTALSSELLPYLETPAEYAEAVKASVLLYNPAARVESRPIGSDGEVQLAFELWMPQQSARPLDWHLVRVRRQAEGLLVHDFVYHNPAAGDKELEKFRKDVDQSRSGWEQELSSAQWPAPPVSKPAADAWERAVKNIRWYIHSPHVFVEKLLIDAPFSLNHLSQPPEHAWLYVRPESALAPADVPIFLEAVRTFRATGLDLKKQPAITRASLSQILEPNAQWPLKPGWRALIDGLRYLNLKETSISDDAATILAQMTPLQVLILNDVITDRGLQTIATALTNLVKFRPGGPLITDRGMSALSNLHKLHRLDLSDTSVTARGLAALKGLPLIEVDLGSSMKNDALAALVSIPSLVHLEMVKAPMTDQGVAYLRNFTSLHTLFIGKQLDDRGMQTLISIPSLRRLDISGARITDAGVTMLGALKDLEELALSRTAVTDRGLAVVVQLRHLRYLEVSDTQVTIAGLHQLAGMPALDVISFSHKGPLKLGELKALGSLPALRTVIINGAPLKPEAMTYLHQHAMAAASPHVFLWEALAFADPMPTLNDDSDVAQWVDKASPKAISDSGLHRIHDVESDLDHVIPDVATPVVEAPVYDEKNFMGEITVNSMAAHAKAK